MPYKIYHIDLPYVDGLSFLVVAGFDEGNSKLTSEWFLAIPDEQCTFHGERAVVETGDMSADHELLTEEGLMNFALHGATLKLWSYERDAATKQERPFRRPALLEDNKNFFISYWWAGRCLGHITKIMEMTLLHSLRDDLQRVAASPRLKRQEL
jgi:hypothetical protein